MKYIHNWTYMLSAALMLALAYVVIHTILLSQNIKVVQTIQCELNNDDTKVWAQCNNKKVYTTHQDTIFKYFTGKVQTLTCREEAYSDYSQWNCEFPK